MIYGEGGSGRSSHLIKVVLTLVALIEWDMHDGWPVTYRCPSVLLDSYLLDDRNGKPVRTRNLPETKITQLSVHSRRLAKLDYIVLNYNQNSFAFCPEPEKSMEHQQKNTADS